MCVCVWVCARKRWSTSYFWTVSTTRMRIFGSFATQREMMSVNCKHTDTIGIGYDDNVNANTQTNQDERARERESEFSNGNQRRKNWWNSLSFSIWMLIIQPKLSLSHYFFRTLDCIFVVNNPTAAKHDNVYKRTDTCNEQKPNWRKKKVQEEAAASNLRMWSIISCAPRRSTTIRVHFA